MSTQKRKKEAGAPISRCTITPHFTQHTLVGDIGIEVVAGIAAHLPLEIDAPDAIKRAYQLLEYASAARRGEVSLSGYEAGIQTLLDAQETLARMRAHEQALPPDLFQGLPNEVITAPLDDALANLMPRYAIKDRLPHFENWLIYWGIVREEDFEEDHRCQGQRPSGAIVKGEEDGGFNFEARCSVAEELIARWKKEGVSEDIYLKARDSIKNWLMVDKRLKDSQNGKAGAEAKKGKQGRVQKKTDKRFGSRLPGEKSKRIK